MSSRALLRHVFSFPLALKLGLVLWNSAVMCRENDHIGQMCKQVKMTHIDIIVTRCPLVVVVVMTKGGSNSLNIV